MSEVGTVDLVVEQGRSFERALQWLRDGQPVDMSNCSAVWQVREDVPGRPLLIEMSTDNGYLTINAVTGTLFVSLPASVTATFPVPEAGGFPDRRAWVHDCEITDSLGRVLPFIRGRWIVVGAVTKRS